MADSVMMNSDNRAYRAENLSVQDNNNDAKVCKICLDGSEENEALIAPCNCAGSVKYAHEECLKVWLLTKNKDLGMVRCEICHEKIEMTYTAKKECLREHACKEGQKQTSFAIALILLVCIFSVAIYIVSSRYYRGYISAAYALTVTFICAFFIILLVALIVHNFIKAFLKETIVNWKIIPKTHEKEIKNQ